MTSHFSTDHEREEVEAFFAAHEHGSSERTIEQSLEHISANKVCAVYAVCVCRVPCAVCRVCVCSCVVCVCFCVSAHKRVMLMAIFVAAVVCHPPLAALRLKKKPPGFLCVIFARQAWLDANLAEIETFLESYSS